jgi:hypothetical protein
VSAWDQSPHMFSTNIKNLVSMSELKVSGIILMIALQCYNCFLPLQSSIFEDGDHTYVHFFNAISKKVFDVVELDRICKVSWFMTMI